MEERPTISGVGPPPAALLEPLPSLPQRPVELCAPPVPAPDFSALRAELQSHRALLARYLGAGAELDAAFSAAHAAAEAEEKKRAEERDAFAKQAAAVAKPELGPVAKPPAADPSWDCNECRRPNAWSNVVCFFCKSGGRPRACPACTVHNFHAQAQCSMCGSLLGGPTAPAAKPAAGGSAVPPPPTKQQRVEGGAGAGAGRHWKCGGCYTANEAALAKCKLCGGLRMSMETV